MKNILFIILVLFFGNRVFSQQFVDVTDTVLAGILCERYPDAMANNCTQIDLSLEAFISDTIDISDTILTDVSPLLELTETVSLTLKNIGIDTIYGDFSKLSKLETLDLSHNLGFSYFPDFGTITSPTFNKLVMTHAEIADTLSISKLKNSLKILNVRNNYLTSVPDLLDFPNLQIANLLGNSLTFHDMVPFLNDEDTYYSLFRQRTFGLLPRSILNKNEGESLEFTIDIDTLHSDNIYYWFKDSVLFDTTTIPSLDFTSLTSDNSGEYYLVIRNSAFSDSSEFLYVRPVNLNVIPKPEECVTLEDLNIEVLTSCEAHQLVYDNIDIDSLTLELRSESDTIFIKGVENVFVNVEDGNYELKLSTSTCEVIYPESIFLQAKNDCDQIISPNGDGIGDQYYIDRAEKIKIVNKVGLVLNEIQGPVLWDGTGSNGELLEAGYYMLLFESGDVTPVTIER